MTDPAEALDDGAKDLEKALPIGVVEEDLFSRVPAV